MIFTELNWAAVAVAGIAGIIIGAVWFGPKTFFPVWWKLQGKRPEDAAGGSNMGAIFGSTFAAAFIQAISLAIFLELAFKVNPNFGVLNGGIAGAFLGFGIGAASSISHRLFGGQGFRVWLLEIGQDIISLTAMGLILAAWR
jgi:hypothetical protein